MERRKGSVGAGACLRSRGEGGCVRWGCCATVELLDWGWGGGAVDGTARRGERRCALKTKATGAKRRASVFQARRANGGVTQARWRGQPWSAVGAAGRKGHRCRRGSDIWRKRAEWSALF